jgi:hypothetical protein
MWKSIHENLKEFWRGCVGGCFAGGGLLYIKQDILISYLLSFLTVAISALVGGLFTALASDLYKHHIKNRLFKNKKDGDKEKEKAA